MMAKVALLDRPEPHFPEGSKWPQPGWQGRILWSLLAAVVVVAIVAAFSTEMVVSISVAGSLARSADGQMQAILLADDQVSQQIQVGQPARLQVDSGSGWGIVVDLEHTYDAVDRHYRRVIVAVVGPQTILGTIDDQACHARILVGFTSTVHGLLQLVTDQATTPRRAAHDELRLRIPEELRSTDRYRKIEKDLTSGLSSR